jgi:ribosomal protein S18 acetylase RimI-like enzyme
MSMPLHPATVTLRAERPNDGDFLREVYGSTRLEELAASGFPPAMKATFLDLQFRAQQTGYRGSFPGAEFQVIICEGRPVGRLVVHRAATEWLLVDLALLTGYRDRGIGTSLIRELAAAATAAGQPLRLTVLQGQRAGRLYQRLGFIKIGQSGLHDLMEYQGGKVPTPISSPHAS